MTNYQMPVLTDEQRERLIEVAGKRLGKYQAMKDAQNDATVRPRGGVEFDYQLSIDLMQIALASLTAEKKTVRPFGLPQIAGEGCWVECEDDEEGATQLYTAPPVLEQKGGWISCSERMPKSDGTYLAWDGRYVTNIAFMFGNWQCNQLILPKISHWQPLPAPPAPPAPQPSNPQIDNDGGAS